MPKLCYVPKRFNKSSQIIIAQAAQILEEYTAKGYGLTIRGLYYKFVARDLFPESWIDKKYNAKHGLAPDTKNTQKNYKKLGSIVNDARLAGLIDWDHIVDRTRNLRNRAHWDDPSGIIKDASLQYHVDMWATQNDYCEVWIEKDALIGVIENVCRNLDVPHFSCRGYTSQSEVWRAAIRIRMASRKHDGPKAQRRCTVFHLGDHDPSGLDMTRDIQDRLVTFGCPVYVKRLALNMSQIKLYDPPPNPAKMTDSRFAKYIQEHGSESWELDALEPEVIEDLIRNAVESLIDQKAWKKKEKEKAEGKKLLASCSGRWDEVVEMLEE